jgi:hypothetical protein
MKNIRVSFFNQPWIAQNVEVGQEVAVMVLMMLLKRP